MLADGEIVPDLSDEILAACCVTSTTDQLTRCC
jgi:H+-translocating NAD(P) transhydrogenase subunit alpha